MSGTPYAFTVGVVGDGNVMSAAELHRLLAALVNRHLDERHIVLLSAGNASPELQWCQSCNWTLQLTAQDQWVKRECELVAWSDAVVVLGDPAPWARLLALCKDARIPTRVYRERPRRLPPVRRPPIGDEGE